MLSDNKGLNVPDVVVPMAALTEKDRSDLDFALDQGVEYLKSLAVCDGGGWPWAGTDRRARRSAALRLP